MAKWLAIFTLVPLIETLLLYVIGQQLGFAMTVGVILFTGIVGAGLAKREGLRVWRSWSESIQQGQLPEEGIVGGVLVLVGGLLLLTPGVLTDALGVSLLVPASRKVIARYVQRYVEKKFRQGGSTVHYRVDLGGGGFVEHMETRMGGFGRRVDNDPNVIDAESEVVEERRDGARRLS